MENMELLQAMRQMMEEVVSPIYERMDKMQEELSSVKEEVASVKEEVASVKEEVASVKSLATKTQIAMENDVVPKIKLLFEGHTILHSRLAQLNEMERILREVQSDVLLLKNIVASHSGDIRMLKRRRIGNQIYNTEKPLKSVSFSLYRLERKDSNAWIIPLKSNPDLPKGA